VPTSTRASNQDFNDLVFTVQAEGVAALEEAGCRE